MSPGCQLDMVVALQSPQGKHKSTGLQAMVPAEEAFTDGLSLHEDDDDFKRLMRGKLVVEIAELAGLSRGDINVVKRTITRRHEEWVEKWQTQPTRYPRRCMLFATTNEERFLPTDETGHRRWLPVEIGGLDRAAIAADRDQLWAEGATIYRASGIAWSEAERLAATRHSRYEQSDVWETEIQRWLDSSASPERPGATPGTPPRTRPLSISEVLAGALRMSNAQMDAKAEKRAGRVLRALGYERRNVKIDGSVLKRWICVTPGAGSSR
jgi:predicted P-loop ATPase